MNHRVPGASLVALLLASPVSAQVTSDVQLRGTVRDATEAVVVTATVVVVSRMAVERALARLATAMKEQART